MRSQTSWTRVLDSPWLGGALCALLTILSVQQSIFTYKDTAPSHFEHTITVPHYLSGDSFGRLVFDIEHTEAPASRSNFQARELSYVFDYLDARALVLFAKYNIAHYLSVTKYVFLCLIVLLLWVAFRSSFHLEPLSAGLLCGIFVTSSSAFNFTFFTHSAKIGASLGIAASLSLFLRYLAHPSPVVGALAFFTTLWTTFFDMQGFFFAIWTTFLCGVIAWKTGEKRWKNLTILCAVVAVAHAMYKYWLGFVLIRAFMGYEASGSFQALPWTRIFDIRTGAAAFVLFLDYFRFLFGNLDLVVAAGLLGGALYFFFKIDPQKKLVLIKGHRFGIRFVIVAGSLLGMLGMLHLMALKFPTIFEPALRHVYYPLPISVTLLFGAALTLASVIELKPASKPFVRWGLVLLLVGNIAALPQRKQQLDATINGPDPMMNEIIVAWRRWNEPHYKPSPGVEQHVIYQAVRKNLGE